MFRMTAILALLLAPLAVADTLAQRLTAIQAGTGVKSAEITAAPNLVPGSTTDWRAEITYTVFGTNTGRRNTVSLLGVNFDPDAAEPNATGEWVWESNNLPEPLRVTPETLFITDRDNGGFTEAQVKSTVQAVWTDATSLDPIIDLEVTPVNGKTIRVTGSFPDGLGDREERTYLLWLEDPNGSVTTGNANIKWQREKRSVEL